MRKTTLVAACSAVFLLGFLGCLGKWMSFDTRVLAIPSGSTVEKQCPAMKDLCRDPKTKFLELQRLAPGRLRRVTDYKTVPCASVLQSVNCGDVAKGEWKAPPQPAPSGSGQGGGGGAPASPASSGGATRTVYSSTKPVVETLKTGCRYLLALCLNDHSELIEIHGTDGARVLECALLFEDDDCSAAVDSLSK
jgi:hypothetical protein